MSTTGQDAPELLSTREGYDRWALIYDEEDNPLIALEARCWGELLGAVEGLDVLDLGCGTGRHALALAAAGARVVAVDFSTEMLARARAKPGAGAVRFVEHDMTRRLPFADGAFDRVTCGLVVDHIVDLAAFFGEMRRVLRPPGFALVSVMHPAMMLLGIEARFTDPATGREVRPASAQHQVSDYVNGARAAGLLVDEMLEQAVDEALVACSPRAARYQGWPLLLMLRLGRV